MNNYHSADRLGLRVTELIRGMILEGQLQPGERLVERELAERLEVSRSPVREALHRLEEEKLLSSGSSGGMRVTVLSQRDVEEIYEVRAALERLVGRLVVSKITKPVVAELHEMIVQMERASQAGDVLAECAADMVFHQHLAKLTGNRTLWDALRALHGQIMQVISLSNTTMSLGRRVKDHQILIDVLEQGQAQVAASALEQHVQYAALKAVEAMTLKADGHYPVA